MNGVQYSKIPSQRLLREELPLNKDAEESIARSRDEIRRILFEDDERFLLVVGPCSVHDISSCIEYAEKLVRLQKKYSSLFYIVMRCYLEKSRTALGWTGFVSSPEVCDEFNIEEGLTRGREFLLRIADMGLPIAYEVVDPLIFSYFDDLVSWASVGARSTRSQLYRIIASAYDFPFAFKNTLEGDLIAPCNAILTSRFRHSFLTINDDGVVSSCCSKGNPYSHLVLRGLRNCDMSFTNYDEKTLKDAKKILLELGLSPVVLVDASHDNSFRKPEKQEDVFFDILKMRYDDAFVDFRKNHCDDVSRMLRGIMLESFIEEGAISEAEFHTTKHKGISITDACIGWERTERIIDEAYEKYKDARKDLRMEITGLTEEVQNVKNEVVKEAEKGSCKLAVDKKIEIYTDGACSGNPGRGGWGFVVVDEGKVIIQKSGFAPETTNNRMEMQAVIEALKELKEDVFSNCQFTVFTDSSYVKNGITQWINKWKLNGWRSSSKAPVKNQDLWLLLDSLSSDLASVLSWKWVKGHAGNTFNELCDRLATEQAQSGERGMCNGEKEQHSLF